MQLKEKPAPLQLEDILVLTEFPPWADAAVLYALSLARGHGARMHVAHAVPTHFFQRVTNMPVGAFAWAQEYQAWLTMLHVVEGIGAWTDHERIRLEEPYRKWMAELVPEELPLWCEVEHRVSFGVAGSAIADSARELQADLIALGLSGLDGAHATRPGTTVLQVIRDAPCPELVVREYLTKRAPLEIARDRRSRAAVAVAA